VRRSGQIIELTQTEYRLLLLLIRGSQENPKKVFETDEIIQFVWPMDPESVFPRTLATHLTNLRKKVNSSKVKFKAVRLSGITVILSE
ncbi:MAG: helix-turn-helix domain-containing protein, partial [Halobacteriovoraceae bacterium]|nr:helix-turn-helix domain-containing protein [Halobacteriovoraceae bacterium]